MSVDEIPPTHEMFEGRDTGTLMIEDDKLHEERLYSTNTISSANPDSSTSDCRLSIQRLFPARWHSSYLEYDSSPMVHSQTDFAGDSPFTGRKQYQANSCMTLSHARKTPLTMIGSQTSYMSLSKN